MSRNDTIQRTCPGCDAVYEIEFWDIANRERNRRTCKTPGCQTVILNENCSRDYGAARLIKQPTRPQQEVLTRHIERLEAATNRATDRDPVAAERDVLTVEAEALWAALAVAEQYRDR